MAMASSAVYRENRARFSVEELRKFDGKWVAFSSDGRCSVGSGSTLADLANQVRATSNNLQDLVLERIDLEGLEINLGGAELQ
jgi:hypothetical protein